MHIETDLKKIDIMGRLKEAENYRFRSFLKQIDKTSEEIDAIVKEINDEVVKQIDCTKCGNCCSELNAMLDDDDIKRFISNVDISKENFMEQFVAKSEIEDDERPYIFNTYPCPFLQEDKKCWNYENRPADCREYPHVDKPDFASRLNNIIQNYSVCPIVYNVFEELKLRLWKKKKYVPL